MQEGHELRRGVEPQAAGQGLEHGGPSSLGDVGRIAEPAQLDGHVPPDRLENLSVIAVIHTPCGVLVAGRGLTYQFLKLVV